MKVVRWILMVVGGFTVAGMLAVAGLVGYLMVEDKIREWRGEDTLGEPPAPSSASTSTPAAS
jgi:hypothetical protein